MNKVARWGLWSALLLAWAVPAQAAEAAAAGFVPQLWTIVPFVGILLSIALFPLFAPHFWEHHYPKISFAWMVGAVVLMFFSVPADGSFYDAYASHLFSTGEEYLSFIILLGSLYVISGGIYISGNFKGYPLVNTAILAIGAVLASLIGTTGAAMLLIRPLMRANAGRARQVHVYIFFIFIVCNVGGSLTPIGDPPLFLGFLQGIPFQWTLHLFPEWAFVCGMLLIYFYMIDRFLTRPEDFPHDKKERIQIKIEGGFNFALLLGVVVAVILSGVLHLGTIQVGGLGTLHGENLLRDGVQIALALLSLAVTSKAIRQSNAFNYGPILEVAYLFIGIFTTMIPALMVLNARGGELGLDTPAKYFWATGALSSFLDNAPTYLTFLAAAMGSLGITEAIGMIQTAHSEAILAGISLGAVFMGSMTYIGNGPNFMVKAMVERNGIQMPSFFGYMIYSIALLLPLFVLLTVLFL